MAETEQHLLLSWGADTLLEVGRVQLLLLLLLWRAGTSSAEQPGRAVQVQLCLLLLQRQLLLLLLLLQQRWWLLQLSIAASTAHHNSRSLQCSHQSSRWRTTGQAKLGPHVKAAICKYDGLTRRL